MPPRRALAVYYGPDAAQALTRFDRVVVQPGHFSAGKVAWLQRRGVQVLAYLSLGEVPNAPPFAGQSWAGGEACPDWNTLQVDLTHPDWQARLQAQVQALTPLFDGFFLDTLDCAARDLRQRRAMLKLIRLLRQWAGSGYLLANRGFALLPRLSGVLDGVLIEAFSTTWLGGYRAYEPHELAYTEQLLNQARRLKLEVYALDYADSPRLRRFAQRRAGKLGVPTFVSNRELSLPGGYLEARTRPAPQD